MSHGTGAPVRNAVTSGSGGGGGGGSSTVRPLAEPMPLTLRAGSVPFDTARTRRVWVSL